jgi:hypothetical protein
LRCRDSGFLKKNAAPRRGAFFSVRTPKKIFRHTSCLHLEIKRNSSNFSLETSIFLHYYRNMKQTITLEVENATVMQLLRNLAEMSLVKFALNQHSNDDLIIAQINEVCKKVDTSLDPSIMAAQMEVLEGDDW